MWIDLITASGVRSLRTLPSTRVDMNGSSIAISPCDGELVDRPARTPPAWRRCQDRRDRCGTTSFRRSSSPRRWPRRWPPVIRSSSSNCAPARPPRFIDENTTLSSSAPSSSRSSRMSDGGQHAVHAGVGERGAQPVEQVGAAVHRGRPRARPRAHRGRGGRRRRSSTCRCRARSAGWCGSATRARSRPGSAARSSVISV